MSKTSMIWEKLGLVYCPDRDADWIASHAYLPTAVVLDADRIRVFLAFRDLNDVGRLGWIDVDTLDPTRVLAVSPRPALDIGAPGAFDDNGVSPLSVVRDGDRLLMYYVGWQLTPRVRYLLFTGLAVSANDGETFVRIQETPVLDRVPGESQTRSGSFVLKDGDVWKMWYAAGSESIRGANGLVPTYTLNYIESNDGIHWPRKGIVAMDFDSEDEFGFGRPFVEKVEDGFCMWTSIRSHSRHYVIGFARSKDGQHWDRADYEVGIERSAYGWDSQMIGFPSIVDSPAGRLMFYNGNGYGRTGVGVAREARLKRY
jgi:predicted GH43/DUF377 family glycosyl hydrolase